MRGSCVTGGGGAGRGKRFSTGDGGLMGFDNVAVQNPSDEESGRQQARAHNDVGRGRVRMTAREHDERAEKNLRGEQNHEQSGRGFKRAGKLPRAEQRRGKPDECSRKNHGHDAVREMDAYAKVPRLRQPAAIDGAMRKGWDCEAGEAVPHHGGDAELEQQQGATDNAQFPHWRG